MMLRVENASYIARNKHILQDISLAANKGQIITILGPNGGGKSTLMNMLAGNIKPTSGKITLDSSSIISYVPQDFFVDPFLPLSVARFLKIGTDLSDNDMSEIIAIMLPGVQKEQRVQSLSGGQKQRMLITRAIFMNPDILLLDEPMQGIDIQSQFYIYDTIFSKLKNALIIIVSHDLDLVWNKSDHIICINKHICCEGKPSEELRQGLSLYRHRHDHHHF